MSSPVVEGGSASVQIDHSGGTWGKSEGWMVESIQSLQGRLGVPFRNDITIIKQYGHLRCSECEMEIIPGEEPQSGVNFPVGYWFKIWKTVRGPPRDLAIRRRGWSPVLSCNIEGGKWDCCSRFKYNTEIQKHRWRWWIGGSKQQSGGKGQMSQWWHHQHKGVSWRHW